jgi:hypothetical protein
MQLGFKAIGAMIIAITCAQPVTANETVDGRELAQVMGQALATGYVDAEIQRSCLIQTTTENRDYVANEAECRESLSELQSVLSEGEGLKDQIDQVKRFRAQYGI